MKPLIIIPHYANKAEHLTVLETAIQTARGTADADIMVIDDCSPLPANKIVLPKLCERFGVDLVMKDENEGFSRTVNVGLRRAYEEGRTGVLCNSDIQFVRPGWLEFAMQDPAPVVGARLLFPSLLIQHGGIYFSLLHQYFDHLFRFAPHNLPEANVRSICPVTGALQIIKPEAMDAIGFYDEEYRLSYEDVDYCIRIFEAGMECAYNPSVVALHHEGLVRMKSQTPQMKEWMDASHARLGVKFAGINLARFAHPIDFAPPAVHQMAGGGTEGAS